MSGLSFQSRSTFGKLVLLGNMGLGVPESVLVEYQVTYDMLFKFHPGLRTLSNFQIVQIISEISRTHLPVSTREGMGWCPPR